jgi:hypothetical protein
MYPEEEHDWLVFVPRGHLLQQFISDLAAYDPAKHDGSPEGVIVAVMAWLSTRRDALRPITPREVLAALPRFQAAKEALSGAWGGYPPWSDTLLAAIEVVRTQG